MYLSDYFASCVLHLTSRMRWHLLFILPQKFQRIIATARSLAIKTEIPIDIDTRICIHSVNVYRMWITTIQYSVNTIHCSVFTLITQNSLFLLINFRRQIFWLFIRQSIRLIKWNMDFNIGLLWFGCCTLYIHIVPLKYIEFSWIFFS